MNKREDYLRLVDMEETMFELDGTEYSSELSEPEVFDKWIHQYVEEIKNVDTSAWTVHERWRIINYIIRAGFLTLNERKLERAPVEAETE